MADDVGDLLKHLQQAPPAIRRPAQADSPREPRSLGDMLQNPYGDIKGVEGYLKRWFSQTFVPEFQGTYLEHQPGEQLHGGPAPQIKRWPTHLSVTLKQSSRTVEVQMMYLHKAVGAKILIQPGVSGPQTLDALKKELAKILHSELADPV